MWKLLVVVLCLVIACSARGASARDGGATGQCLGEFQRCATGDCVMLKDDCGKCADGLYLCPSRKQGLCRKKFSDCPDIPGTIWDWTLSVEKRLALLVNLTTLEEKISQMNNDAKAIPRLNIPNYNWWNDDLHGLSQPEGTSFPDGCGLGATWSTKTIKEVGHAIAVEARGFHQHTVHDGERAYGIGFIGKNAYGMTIYGPNINIVRDPRWGRAQETYGEDPKLTAEISAAYVQGMQTQANASGGGGDANYYGAAACCKHFAAYDLDSIPIARYFYNAKVDARNLLETYFAAFEVCVKKGQPLHVMCSYNAINGIPACADGAMMNGVLRGKWGFDGFVISDFDAWAFIYATHGYSHSMAEAAADGLNAGCDQEGGSPIAVSFLPEALKKNKTTVDKVNRAFSRIFKARILLGMLDPPEFVPFATLNEQNVSTTAHMALNLRTSQESMCLYKNRNGDTLPLNANRFGSGGGKKIAVIGPNSAATEWLQGNYGTPPSSSMVSVLEGITNRVAFPANGSGSCSAVQGASYGRSRNRVATSTAGDCCSACTADLSCNYYTYEGGMCNKFGTLPVSMLKKKGAGVVSGARPGLALVEGGLDFSKYATSTQRAEDFRQCAQLCRLDASCNYFTFNDGKCHAAKDNTQYTISLTAVSGASPEKPTQVVYAPGCLDGMTCENTGGFAAAAAAAASADTVILVLGLDQTIEREAHDRTTIDLPSNQYTLFDIVRNSSANPLVTVLVHGGTMALKQVHTHSDAILDAWYPSQQGGNAVASVLFGDVNPAGRATTTYYRDNIDLPPSLDYQNLYPSGQYLGLTYRYYNGTALAPPTVPFGYGLSYTQFRYSNLTVSPTTPKTCDDITVTVAVENIGGRSGDEVVQVYVRQPHASVPAPRIRLAAFDRVHVAKGASVVVTMVVEPAWHSVVAENAHGQDIYNAVAEVEQGAFDIYVGGGQPDRMPPTSGAPLHASVTVSGQC